jgi:hypothetical protein
MMSASSSVSWNIAPQFFAPLGERRLADDLLDAAARWTVAIFHGSSSRSSVLPLRCNRWLWTGSGRLVLRGRLTTTLVHDVQIEDAQMPDFEFIDLEPFDSCPADRESTDRECAEGGRSDRQGAYRGRSAESRAACV